MGGNALSLPSVTVVILVYCNDEEAAACIETVLASDYPALTILVVDNLSPDGSGERLRARFPQVEHLQTGFNGGYAAGNNRGMEWALSRGADYVLLLNDDTEIAPDCITKLVRAATDTGAAATTPLITYFDEPNIVWYGGGTLSRARGMCRHWLENEPVDPTQTRTAISFACGCCLLLDARVLREVGGFDESYFMYGEDLELSLRLAKRGEQMWYEPAARVLHRTGRSQPPTPRQIILRDTNRRRMVSRHYSLLERLVFIGWFYPTRAIHLARYLAERDWARARSIIVGAFGSIADTKGPTDVGRAAGHRGSI